MKNDAMSDGWSRELRAICLALSALLLGCSASDGNEAAAAGSTEPLFVTSSVVFSSEGESTYVSSLATLEDQEIDLKRARELPGWSGIWGHGGKLFVGDGESPVITRYAVDDQGTFTNEGELSFLEHGAHSADTLFVSADKAYVFAEDAVVWEPEALQIVESFGLPEVAAREGGLQYSGLRTGRGTAVRGDRAYIATNWANWDEYDVAEDSAIVVIDTRKNEIIETLPVPCPYLDVASLDDDGTIYFSNWVYSLGPTLSSGKAKACAVRILPGEDRLDRDWSLTFADVTEGREAAALRALGDGKALISVYHDEQADLTADHAALADGPNWRFWILDLRTLAASPLEGIGFHAGGFNTARIDGRNFLLVPSGDYETTTTYELLPDGSAEPRWESRGWSTQLLRLR
jgi:hypothetical protein